MIVTGKITGVKYKQYLPNKLEIFDENNFNINKVPSSCILNDFKNTFAISKWVSPKRTRSYPYERVYNTLNHSKKITVIPIVKDEGANGDRDFLQWDTVSLMSLLDIYVIFAYYCDAEKIGSKISNQKFDNEYVIQKIKEIEIYHSSALHWNINELKTNFQYILNKVILCYKHIEKKTNISLHNINGLYNFKERIGKDVSQFMEFSRGKAIKAQEREFLTIQPKENLSTSSKAKITITNYLGGNYFFTVDEIYVYKKTLFLIEGKHSINSILPTKSDIKDGLLKMMLYCNLIDTKLNGNSINCKPILELTSTILKGQINSNSTANEISNFFDYNSVSLKNKMIVRNLFIESKANNFTVTIKQSNIAR